MIFAIYGGEYQIIKHENMLAVSNVYHINMMCNNKYIQMYLYFINAKLNYVLSHYVLNYYNNIYRNNEICYNFMGIKNKSISSQLKV